MSLSPVTRSKYKCIERVELLPYHKMGAHKWQQLNLVDPLESIRPPAPFEVKQAREIFRLHAPGLSVY